MSSYSMYSSAWKNSAVEAQEYNIQGTGSPVAYTPPSSTKGSWTVPELYDHTSLLECTRCTQGTHMSYGGQGVSSGQASILNIMEGEVMQELQYGMDMEEEEEMGGFGMDQIRMMKKRKLTEEQARQLEASFEADKKLEAEKKQRLAAQLGLQPRQVAVWFQNRRARSKTKQLEIDFLALKSEYDRVLAQRRALQDEIARLATLLQAKNSETKMNSCNQDSTSSSNSNNGELVSESTTPAHIKMESLVARDGFNAPYNTSTSPPETGKSKEGGIPKSQDLEKYSSINSYEWEPYDNGLWVFD